MPAEAIPQEEIIVGRAQLIERKWDDNGLFRVGLEKVVHFALGVGIVADQYSADGLNPEIGKLTLRGVKHVQCTRGIVKVNRFEPGRKAS